MLITKTLYSNSKTKKQAFYAPTLYNAPVYKSPNTYLPLTKSTNEFSAKRQSVPVEEPKIISTGTKSFL